jgi:hypothetical protein
MNLYSFLKSQTKICWFAGVIIVSGIVLSCDSTLEPLDQETGIFSIYGVLNIDDQTHYIRIKNLNDPFTPEATREIDADVMLENLDSGTSEVLQSERIEYEGVYLHNFKVDGIFEADANYKLTITRFDGAEVSITMLTPKRTEAIAFPVNQDCDKTINVEIESVNGGAVNYLISYMYNGFRRVAESGVLNLEDNMDGSLAVNFIPNEILRPQFRGLSCQDIDEDSFRFSYWNYSPGLYEKILNDPFDILQSTERFGFVYRNNIEILVDTSKVCPLEC